MEKAPGPVAAGGRAVAGRLRALRPGAVRAGAAAAVVLAGAAAGWPRGRWQPCRRCPPVAGASPGRQSAVPPGKPPPVQSLVQPLLLVQRPLRWRLAAEHQTAAEHAGVLEGEALHLWHAGSAGVAVVRPTLRGERQLWRHAARGRPRAPPPSAAQLPQATACFSVHKLGGTADPRLVARAFKLDGSAPGA